MIMGVPSVRRPDPDNPRVQRTRHRILAVARDLLPECYPDPADLARAREYILHPTPGWTDFKIRLRDSPDRRRRLDHLDLLLANGDNSRTILFESNPIPPGDQP